MHFAIGLTHSVLITERGTVSYLATVAFLPGCRTCWMEEREPRRLATWLVGWTILFTYYEVRTPTNQRGRRGRERERLLEKRWFRKLGVVTRPTDGGRARR